MNQSIKPKPHVPSVRPEWLALRQEDILSPDLRVIDAHFHIWDFSAQPYFAAELAQDFHSGHHVVGSVFVECTMGYLTEGPEQSRCVGETMFVADQASGCRRPILPRSSRGRISRRALQCRRCWSSTSRKQRGVCAVFACGPHGMPTRRPAMAPPECRSGCCIARPCARGCAYWRHTGCRWTFGRFIRNWTTSRIWRRRVRACRSSRTTSVAHWRRPLRGPTAGGVRPLVKGDPAHGAASEHRDQAGRARHLAPGASLCQRRHAAGLRSTRRGVGAVCADLYRGVRATALHVRQQLPGGQGHVQLSRPAERVQADNGLVFPGGDIGDLQPHRRGHLSHSSSVVLS